MANTDHGLLYQADRYDEEEEQLCADILLLMLDREISRKSSLVFGSLAPFSLEVKLCEFRKRLVMFARTRRISLRDPNWEQQATARAAGEHPELQPKKTARGRPRKVTGFLSLLEPGPVDPDSKWWVEYIDALNETRKSQGQRPLSDRRLAQVWANERGGGEAAIASNTKQMANKLAAARDALGRRKRPKRVRITIK